MDWHDTSARPGRPQPHTRRHPHPLHRAAVSSALRRGAPRQSREDGLFFGVRAPNGFLGPSGGRCTAVARTSLEARRPGGQEARRPGGAGLRCAPCASGPAPGPPQPLSPGSGPASRASRQERSTLLGVAADGRRRASCSAATMPRARSRASSSARSALLSSTTATPMGNGRPHPADPRPATGRDPPSPRPQPEPTAAVVDVQSGYQGSIFDHGAGLGIDADVLQRLACSAGYPCRTAGPTSAPGEGLPYEGC
jgi:hypothetical protein